MASNIQTRSWKSIIDCFIEFISITYFNNTDGSTPAELSVFRLHDQMPIRFNNSIRWDINWQYETMFANPPFWREKIETNQTRDIDTNKRLKAAGWKVIRFWEHEDPDMAADKIAQAVRERSAHYSEN